jgi:carboxyl-terminal processing protease
MNVLTRTTVVFIGFLLVLSGCDSMFMEPDPPNTPDASFEIFWRDFDRYYAQFSVRHIDWDSVYTLYRPQITASTSDRQLFTILSSIVYGINDMHVTLYTPLGDVYWKSMAPASYPSRRLINGCKYVHCGSAQRSILEYRTCQDTGFGYVSIPTFSGEGDGLTIADGRYLVIDDILSQWKAMKGIIIDVRGNPGGSMVNAEAVAGRFADGSHIYSYRRQKTGPGRDDLSPWKSSSIEPKGSYQFLGPVVVLTSRATSSAAEMFVMAMQALPNVTVVGDTTGGGVGNPIFRELPNGWTYRLSTEVEADAQGRIVEGVGVYPDIPVQTTAADSANGIDRIMERGLDILKRSQ